MLDFNHVLTTPGVDIQRFFGISNTFATVAGNQAAEWRTWTKPRGVNWVYMIAVGGGSGGTTGTFTGASAASAGAAGGGSGAQSTLLIPAVFVPNQLFIQLGSGGRVTTVVSGASGQAGGTTMVAVEPAVGVTSGVPNIFFLVATGGAASGGGTATTMSGNFPLAGRGWSQNFAGQGGGAAGTTQTGAGGSITLPTTGLMVTGGAGSGGKDVTGATRGAGGAITGVGLGGTLPTHAGGVAAATGVNAGNGIDGRMVTPYMFYGGSGGGAGGHAATGTGANGGAGGNGGPGCGGGASGPGYSTTGLPGWGGDGFVIIISW
jgi:hypothetical protein